MNGLYEYTGGNSAGPPGGASSQNNYLSYLASSMANGNDYLNSSQNEKNWLNNSFGDKSWLNSSLCLPPEQRYQSLNEMVTKIVEDENQKSLMASGNSLSLSFNQFKPLGPTGQSIIPQTNQNQVYQMNYSTLESQQKPDFNRQNKEQIESLSYIIQPTNSKRIDHPLVPQVQVPLQSNNLNINRIAYPQSFSHQLATLTMDQQNYLLQQQRALVMTLAATEQYVQNQYLPAQNFLYTNQQYPALNRTISNEINPNINYTIVPKVSSIGSTSSNSSQSSNYSQNYSTHNTNKMERPINFNQYYIPPHVQHEPSIISPMYENVFYANENHNFIPVNLSNENFKYYPRQINTPQQHPQQQPYRHHRRTGPANELHVRLEECLYQFKCLENERKKIETELCYLNLNRKYNNQNNHANIPRLSANPSRVDRLIVEAFKEHFRVLNLVTRIDNLKNTIFYSNIQNTIQNWLCGIQNVQMKRKEELVNNANRQRLNNNSSAGTSRVNSDEKDISILANSINELSILTSKVRTCLWCVLQISNVNFNLQPGDTLFDNQHKTIEFIDKTFEIKTDLIDFKF